MPDLKMKLDDPHARAIVELGIEYGAYDGDEMPKTKKERLAAAEEIINFSIDAWVTDGMTPDDENEDVAASGRQIEEILEMGGVEIDDDGEPVYGDLPELEEEDETRRRPRRTRTMRSRSTRTTTSRVTPR